MVRIAFRNGQKCTPPKVLIVPHFPMSREENVQTGFLADQQYSALLTHLPAGVKSLFVTPILSADMRNLLNGPRQERDASWPNSPWLFNRQGERIKDLRGTWAKACERAGVPDLKFRDVRRTAVRNMRRAGVPQVVRMKISGHKTDSMERRYNIVGTVTKEKGCSYSEQPT